MDFEVVFKRLIAEFEKKNINYALIGGFALGIYGVIRSTNDLDFLIDKRQEGLLKGSMAQSGYGVIHESENVIQFENPDVIFGTIDFLYAFRKPSLKMLKRAVRKKIFNETINLVVLMPEDIIGLKVQSFVNNPQRKVFDLEDIKNLIEANSTALQWKIIQEHFILFGLNDLFRELKEAYGAKG